MNISNTFYFLSFILLVITSCSESNGSSFYESPFIEQELSLKKVDEIILQSVFVSGHTIGRLRFTFATSRDGSLHAFYDEAKKQFIISDNEGVIQKIISNEGKGPGEIVKAGGFNFDEQNNLVVYDQNQRMIKVFNMEGEVVNYSKVGKSNYPIASRKLQIYDKKIFASTMDLRLLGGDFREKATKSKLTAVYNYNGELIDTLGTYDPTVKDAKSYNIFPTININSTKGYLLSSHFNNYRIQIYDFTSKKRIAWFGRKTHSFKEKDEYISPYIPIEKIKEKSAGRSTAVSVHSLTDYVVLYFETLTKAFFKTNNFNEKLPYIVIYDNKSYACYGEIALPYVLGNVVNDKFYLIEDDNPDHFTVGIYELTEKN